MGQLNQPTAAMLWTWYPRTSSFVFMGGNEVRFMGCIKELSTPSDTEEEPEADHAPVDRPPQYGRYEDDIREEFKDVICTGVPAGLPPKSRLKDGRILEHVMPLKPDASPAAKQPYRLSQDELQVREQLTKLVSQGWIRPSLSPWGAPVLFQRKKSGKLRMCIDYRAINHQPIKHAYPMPRVEDLLQKLKGCKVVSKLDLVDGFHQIRKILRRQHL
jgi:hypothetical protein